MSVTLSPIEITAPVTFGITGPAGDDGAAVEMQVTATHIQYRVVGSPTWINLVALSTITGPEGDPGATGATGPNAVSTSTTSSITGMIKGANGVLAAATEGTDYLATVPSGHVTNAKLANMPASTIKGQIVGGSGAPVDMTATQARTALGLATTDAPTFGDGTTISGGVYSKLYMDGSSGGVVIFRCAGVAKGQIYDDGAYLTVEAITGQVRILAPDGVIADFGAGRIACSKGISLAQSTVATLPTASTYARSRYEVTDASSPVVGATVSSGGSERATVRSDGTNWKVTEVL